MQELLTADADENLAPWLEIASVVDSLAYTVKDLKPLCFYRFRVRAENVHGRSEPGFPSDRVHINEENEDLTEGKLFSKFNNNMIFYFLVLFDLLRFPKTDIYKSRR